ncbi:PREDICTED: uncharacterized protein LOC107188933 [Dufourea novaeangliae]|uniref:uncharacterized protein LOC107188933 n=1 Tax=Dufourea novaeangliae TaxID=178035 RepID=UPI000767256C|nr:PREDICTED: uncharacterized protein LOC107188933 [Dufourea novaeangliae]
MNTKGNYAYPSWVSTESRNSTKKSHFRKTFMKYAKLYCKYTKLAGFKYFVDEETSWFDRFLLLLAYAFTVPALIYTIYGGYLDVMQNPCFSSVDTEYLPTQELDFPGKLNILDEIDRMNFERGKPYFLRGKSSYNNVILKLFMSFNFEQGLKPV